MTGYLILNKKWIGGQYHFDIEAWNYQTEIAKELAISEGLMKPPVKPGVLRDR